MFTLNINVQTLLVFSIYSRRLHLPRFRKKKKKSASKFVPRAVAVAVFTLNRSFYPTTSAVPPASFLILHPREIQILWSQ